MSQGSLVEIAEHKSVPPKAGKRKRKFLFLAGAVVLIVLAVIAGIVWMLFITGTTLCVPALMGAIMCMGVATANSVLVVTFAK
jgi:Cu/Ag efflux pump CusA